MNIITWLHCKSKIIILLTIFSVTQTNIFATVTILKATGGTSISADKASNSPAPVYTTLGIIRLTEGTFSDFAVGTNVTFILNAPSGWTFNTAAGITATYTALRDITAASVLSVTTSAITVQYSVGSTLATDVLTITGVQVRASDGANVTGAGNITKSGTAVITGCATGTNLGTLTQAAGATYRLLITLPGQVYTDAVTLAGSGNTGSVTNQTAATSFTITKITAIDQFYNKANAYVGAKTITFTGPSNGLTTPTYTTAVTFAAGQSSTVLTTTLKKAETTTITATDGTITGLISSSLVVNPGTVGNFLVESSGGGNIGSQNTGTPFNIRVTARDSENNICNSGPNVFTGTVDITSTGTLTTGSGTTAALTAGVLASHSVAISNVGTFTITATRTSGGVQSGTSNSFSMNTGVVNNFLVEAVGGGNIGSQIAGTSFNIKITARDAGNNVCSSGPNTFTGTVNLTSTGTISAGGGITASFVAGVLTSTPITLSNTGSFTITATRTGGSETGASNSFSVDAGILNNFLVESSSGGNIGSQVTNVPFSIKITARDIYNNTCNSGPNIFSGTTDISSTGTLSAGAGTTASFTSGVLSSTNVTISNGGNFTITATKTGGGASGTSNTFTTDNPPPSISQITPSCVLTGGSAFTLIVDGTNFTGSSVVRINNSNRTTSFINATQVQADITAGDISVSGIYTIDVVNPIPGGGPSTTINLTVSISPVINVQPSSQIECNDSSATFNVTATGTGMTYQWKKNGIAITNGGNISGATSPTLTINPVNISDTSSFYTVVISTTCHADVISTNAGLSVLQPSSATANISICDGQSYTPPGGSAQTTSGTYVTYILNAGGCDSTITTNLTVISNSSSTANISICAGQSYTPPGGTAQTTTGTYVTHISNAAGCDSAITTNLTVIPNTSSTANITICSGQSYTPPGGTAQTTTGTYVTHISNAAGCDSAITTNLTVNSNTSSTANISICQGQSYTPPGGSAQTSSGMYVTHIPNAAGCDSAITTNLSVIPNTTATANITICTGSSYTPPGGSAQTSSGMYITHIPNTAGCDSAITTNLSVIPAVSSSQNIEICEGESAVLPDLTVVSPAVSTDYTTTFPSINIPGCDSVVTTHVIVNPLPVLTATATQIQCLAVTGSVSLSTSNGTPTYVYSGSDTLNLAPGSYEYFVIDSKGCEDSVSVTINSATSQLSLTATPTQIKCYGMKGSVTLNAIGGVTPYVFSGDSTINLVSGTYNYSVTDASGCTADTTVTIDAAPPQLIHTATATQIACYLGRGSVSLSTSGGVPPYIFTGSPTTNLTNGIFVYNVTDSRGCVKTTTAYIAPAPAKLTGIAASTATRCDSSTGTVSVAVTGGSAPYTFLWNTIPAQTTPHVTGLATGTYSVTITDGHGCTATTSKAVTQSLPTPVTITGKNISCPGTVVSLCATSGFVSYSWNTGDLTRCSNALAAGTYTVTATNAKGCTSTASKVLTGGTTPVCTITGNNYLCQGSSINLCASPGFTTYKWNNGLSTQCRTVTGGGTYSVTVTNAAGCSLSVSHTVKPPISVTTSVTNGACANGFLGSANVNVTGQTSPYSYLWSNAETTQGISNLGAGPYSVVVTDINGCTASAATNIAVTKQSSDYSTINTSFLNYTISPGSYIWFSASVKVNYTGVYPLTIYFTNQNIISSKFNMAPSNAKLVLSNLVSQATTTFNGTEWVTTAPPSLTGQYFISGYSYPDIITISPNLNPVSWKGIWAASCPGVTSVEWKWSAAVYSSFSSALNSLGVKPVDDASASQYNNSDLAGSPENYKANCIAGARGTGGTNYIGNYSSVGIRVPCSPSVCNLAARLQAEKDIIIESNLLKEPGITHNVFPNPFTSTVNIEFERGEKTCLTIIDVFNIKGQKVATLFKDIIDPKIKYRTLFNAEELPAGIYIYKIISGEDVINGKLILRK